MTVTNRSPPRAAARARRHRSPERPPSTSGHVRAALPLQPGRRYWLCASTHQDVWRCWPWRRDRRSARPGPTLPQVVQPARTRQINTGEGKARTCRGPPLIGCVVTPIIGRPRPHAQLPHPARPAPQPHHKTRKATLRPTFGETLGIESGRLFAHPGAPGSFLTIPIKSQNLIQNGSVLFNPFAGNFKIIDIED